MSRAGRLRALRGPSILLCLGLLPFLPALFGGGILVFRDHLAHFLPKRWLLAEVLSGNGSLLWNPYLSTGVPLFADPQMGAVYPPATLMFGLLPFRIAFNLYPAVHLVLAGWGMLLYLRDRNLSPGASLFGAVTLMWSGFAFSTTDIVNNLCSWAWLPWVLLCAHRATKDRSAGWIGHPWTTATGIALTLCFLAGEPIVATAAAAIVTIQFLTGIGNDSAPPWLQRTARLGWCGLISAGLSACVALPFLAWVSQSVRGAGIPLEVAAVRSLHPVDLLDMLAPLPFEGPGGTRWQLSQDFLPSLYLGWVPLFSLFWLSRDRWRKLWPWAGLFVLGLLLALGGRLPGYGVLHEHFGFSLIRYPVRFVFLSVLAFAVLCGHGAEALFLRLREGRSIGMRQFLMPAAPAAWMAAAFLFLPGSWPDMVRHKLALGLGRGALFVLLCGFFGWLASCKKIPLRVFIVVMLSLAALDLGVIRRPGFTTAPYPQLVEPIAELQSIEFEGSFPPRVFCAVPLGLRELYRDGAGPSEFAKSRRGLSFLPPGGSLLFGVAEVSREPVLPLQAYEPFHAALQDPSARGLSEFLGVQRRIDLVRTRGELSIRYRHIDAEPSPLRLLDLAEEPLPDRPGAVAEWLLELGENPPTALPVSERIAVENGLQRNPGCALRSRIEDVRWLEDAVEATVHVNCPTLLVLTMNAISPGDWRTQIDGEEAAHSFLALEAFPAISLEERGTHAIRFAYRSPSSVLGLLLSAGTVFLVLLLTLGRNPRIRSIPFGK